MDVTIKHRLVGAAVLLALAVIFLPMLFDGANQRALLSDTRMPEAPVVPAAETLLEEPAPRMAAAEEEIAQVHEPAEPEPAVVAPVAVAPAPPASGAEAVPTPAAGTGHASPPPGARTDLAEAWDVQVAALATADAAEKLRAKLAKAGYNARVRAVQSAGKTVYRVLVGPELRRDVAVTLRDRLAADARVGKPSGLLQRYVP